MRYFTAPPIPGGAFTLNLSHSLHDFKIKKDSLNYLIQFSYKRN